MGNETRECECSISRFREVRRGEILSARKKLRGQMIVGGREALKEGKGSLARQSLSQCFRKGQLGWHFQRNPCLREKILEGESKGIVVRF